MYCKNAKYVSSSILNGQHFLGGALNLWHLRVVVKTIAKFHAISLCYKKVMFDVFKTHSAQVSSSGDYLAQRHSAGRQIPDSQL